MPISLVFADGDHRTMDAPPGVDPKDEIERIKNREGQYANGWITLRGGEHRRIDDIQRMRVFTQPS